MIDFRASRVQFPHKISAFTLFGFMPAKLSRRAIALPPRRRRSNPKRNCFSERGFGSPGLLAPLTRGICAAGCPGVSRVVAPPLLKLNRSKFDVLFVPVRRVVEAGLECCLTMRKNFLRSIAVGMVMLFAGWLCECAAATTPRLSVPLTLAWDAANDLSVRGYAIYYGFTNQPATNRLDAGANLRVTLFNLQASRGYRMYAVSYNAEGIESIPSNQIQVTLPAMSRLSLTRLSDGKMQLYFRAAPGTACRIQYASQPAGGTWQTWTNLTTDLVGEARVVDASAPGAARRFYRAVTP